MKSVILVLIIILLISFFPLIFLNKTFFFADNFMLMVPGKMFAAESLKRGTIPLWNPYILAGVPFLADISQSLVYPSTLLFVIFPPSTALTISILSHLFWGSLGMAMLSYLLWKNRYHSLLAATAWMLSPILLASVNNLAVMQSVSWLPWMIYFALRITQQRYSHLHQIALILCMSLSILGGHPYPFLYGGIFMGLFILIQPLDVMSKMKRFIPVVLLWVTLSAVVLFPFIEAIGFSTRTHMSVSESTSGILKPAHMLAMFVPNFFSDMGKGILWGADWGKTKGITGYVSILGVIALVFLMRKWKTLNINSRLLLIVGFFGLLYTFGIFLPVMSVLYALIPGFRFLRSPGEAGILWVMCGSLLLGEALDSFVSFLKFHYRVIFTILTLSGVTLLFTWVAQHFYFHELWQIIDNAMAHKLSQSAFHTEVKDLVIIQHVLKQLGIAIVMFGVTAWALLKQKKVLLFVFIAADLWIVSIPSLYFAPYSIFQPQSPQASFLQSKNMQQYRFLSLSGYLPWTGLPTYWDNMTLRPPFAESRFTTEESQTFSQLIARRDNLAMDWGLPYHLSTPMGYGAFVLQSSAEYWETTQNGASVNELDATPLHDVRLNEQGIKYVLIDKYVMNVASILQENPRLNIVKDAQYYAIAENPDALPIIRSNVGEIDTMNIRVNGISFTAHMKNDGDVFIAESWYPGWKCIYNETSCELHKQRGGMSITLPKGDWDVELQFSYRNMELYVVMSLGTLMGLGIWGVVLWTKRGKQSVKRVK